MPDSSTQRSLLCRFEEGKPIPVYCSCNGVVSIDSRAFYDKKLTFRSKNWHGECSASEYTHFCSDLWKAYGSDTRIVMDGRVVVSYTDMQVRVFPPWFHLFSSSPTIQV